MIRTFIGRATELGMLERAYETKTFQCIIIYGRRRIGKTELIKTFLTGKQSIYHLCDQQGTVKNIERFSRNASSVLETPRFAADNIMDLFESIIQVVGREHRLVVAIDEFPYLVERDRAIPSMFQVVIDEILKTSSVFLILCGSSVAMMEESTLNPTSPLHGRRTGQIRVKMMPFKDASAFFPYYSTYDKILVYSILGGVPAYLAKVDPSKSVLDNIEQSILQKDQVLYEEPEHLLRQEVREPRQYMAILEALAKGNTRISDIANAASIAAKDLPVYLTVLMKLEIVEKVQPVTETRPSSKRSLYKVQDDFLRFWFRFVFPHKGMIEIGTTSELVLLIRDQLNHHASLAFENICREFLISTHLWSVNFTRAGTWWEKDVEIDILCLNTAKAIALFGECKWQDGVDGYEVLSRLRQKAKHVGWKSSSREEYFVVFARSFSRVVEKEDRTRCIDLTRLSGFVNGG